MRMCSRCGVNEAAYLKNAICKECQKAQNRAYYEANRDAVKKQVLAYREQNREKVRESMAACNKRRYDAAREKVFEIFGGKCACCGESIRKFLTVDHVESDGHIERKSCGSAKMLEGVLLQPHRYQLLCWNCNCGRAINGGICPHKDSEGSTTSRKAYAQVSGSAEHPDRVKI